MLQTVADTQDQLPQRSQHLGFILGRISPTFRASGC